MVIITSLIRVGTSKKVFSTITLYLKRTSRVPLIKSNTYLLLCYFKLYYINLLYKYYILNRTLVRINKLIN